MSDEKPDELSEEMRAKIESAATNAVRWWDSFHGVPLAAPASKRLIESIAREFHALVRRAIAEKEAELKWAKAEIEAAHEVLTASYVEVERLKAEQASQNRTHEGLGPAHTEWRNDGLRRAVEILKEYEVLLEARTWHRHAEIVACRDSMSSDCTCGAHRLE